MMKIRKKAIGNNRNITPEYQTNHSYRVSSNTDRSHLKNYRNEKVSVSQRRQRRPS